MSESLAARYKRWRHTRGYGVHSPFAYRLLMRVVRPGVYGRYGYADIDTELGRKRPGVVRSDLANLRHRADMLLRLACDLQPVSAALPADIDPVFKTALRAANTRISLSSIPGHGNLPSVDMICMDYSADRADDLLEFISHPNRTLCISNAPFSLINDIANRLDCGLIFEGQHNSIIISRPEMQLVRYTINI